MTQEQNKSGLATAGMVLGIIAIVGCWIPFINIVSIILGVLAFIFGIIPLIKKRSVGKAVTGVVLGVLSVAIGVYMTSAATTAIDEATSPTKTTVTESNSTESNKEEPTFDGAAAFDKVKNGMTKDEVGKIAGVEPSSCTENQDETFGKTEYCSYGNMFTDKVTFDVVYSQGKVSSKTKSTN